MTEMIAFCGLNCSQCPVLIATQNDDDEGRAKAAEMLNKGYGLKFKTEEINCDGCKSEGGRLLGFCNTCEIRECGMGRKYDTCASCTEHTLCEKLTTFHSFAPSAKTSFEELLKKT